MLLYKTMNFIAFGEVLWDVIDKEEYLGGAPLNLLAHAKIMGADSYLISAIGNDERGQKIAAQLKGDVAVSDTLVQVNEHPTGWVDVDLSGDGQPTYTIHEEVAFDNIAFTDEMKMSLEQSTYDIFCFGTLAQRSTVSRETLYKILESIHTKEVFFDVNLRQNYYNREMIEKSLNSSSIVKLNDGEVTVLAKLLYDEELSNIDLSSKIISDFELKIVIVTKGKKGCSVYATNEAMSLGGIKVTPTDTVGAGDAFSAAFLYTYLSTGDIGKSAEFANKVGAYVTSQSGAIPTDRDYLNKI